jgi:hypothetical protein
MSYAPACATFGRFSDGMTGNLLVFHGTSRHTFLFDVFKYRDFLITPLESALTRPPVSVHYTGLTEKLNPLESALTKNKGGGGATARQFLHQRLAFSEPRPLAPLHVPRESALFRQQLLRPFARRLENSRSRTASPRSSISVSLPRKAALRVPVDPFARTHPRAVPRVKHYLRHFYAGVTACGGHCRLL